MNDICVFFFCLVSESSRYLLQVLESVSEADLDEVLERILDAVEKQPRKLRLRP